MQVFGYAEASVLVVVSLVRSEASVRCDVETDGLMDEWMNGMEEWVDDGVVTNSKTTTNTSGGF